MKWFDRLVVHVTDLVLERMEERRKPCHTVTTWDGKVRRFPAARQVPPRLG